MSYWQDRMAKAQQALSEKSVKKIEAQLKRYYSTAMKRTIADFEATYNKVLAAMEEGKEPTPADLYKLDSYWKSQGQLRRELQKLGERQIVALSKEFEINFFEVYYSYALDGAETFSTIDEAGAQQLINQIWCADGQSWSNRIWKNTERLAETLNEELINCITTGKKTTQLKQILQERFGASYSAADSLVRTEIAHIQTEAAKQRYKDYGIQKVQIWADEDERRCEHCGKLHEKIYFVGEAVPVPAHPRCRCCVLPVVE